VKSSGLQGIPYTQALMITRPKTLTGRDDCFFGDRSATSGGQVLFSSPGFWDSRSDTEVNRLIILSYHAGSVVKAALIKEVQSRVIDPP